MAEIEKRKLVGKAVDFFQDQLLDIDTISKKTGITRASLLREGAEHVINKYRKHLKK